MIIIDSREKHFDHISSYFDKQGVAYEVRKLDTGDYWNTENPTVLIDRKANLQEICSNLSSGKGNIDRFTAECKRAHEEKQRFIVLIEGTNAKSVRDLSGWKSRYSRHTGKWLVDKMFGLTVSYGVEWMFCKTNETAKVILELLNYDN